MRFNDKSIIHHEERTSASGRGPNDQFGLEYYLGASPVGPGRSDRLRAAQRAGPSCPTG
jgi:hypothetical protein